MGLLSGLPHNSMWVANGAVRSLWGQFKRQKEPSACQGSFPPPLTAWGKFNEVLALVFMSKPHLASRRPSEKPKDFQQLTDREKQRLSSLFGWKGSVLEAEIILRAMHAS